MHNRAAILALLSVAMLVGCGGAGRGGADASTAHAGRVIVPSSDFGALPPGHPPILPEGHPPVPGLPEGHPPIGGQHPPIPDDGFRCPRDDRATKPVFEFAPSEGQNEVIST